MLAWPYLITKGWLPYRDIAIAHNPILLTDLTIFNRIFGIGLLQLKIYTWIWIILTDVILFFVSKKLWNLKTAVLTLFFYIPLQIVYEGNGLWFDLALAPLVLLVYFSLKKGNYLWSGVFFGLAFFIKQTAFWFAIPSAYFFLKDLRKREFTGITSVIKGFIIITAVVFLTLTLFGILPDYFEWAVKFGVFYLPHAKGQVVLPTIKSFLIAFFPFVIAIPYLLLKKGKNRDLIFWTFFTAMGVYPRFELFHFQPALPFLAIITGIVILDFAKRENRFLKITLLGYLVAIMLIVGRFVGINWGKEDRFYGQNEMNVASFVKASTEPGEKIYVLKYWDSIYTMTQTIPTTRPLVPFLPWYIEYDNFRNEVVGDLLVNMPKLIVAGDYTESGLGSYKLEEIDEVLDRYYILSYGMGGVRVYQLER